MDRRDRNKPPRPGMVWNRKHGMWIDRDTRTAGERARDKRVAAEMEADQKRIRAALRAAEATQAKQESTLDEAAGKLAMRLLGSLVDARKKVGLSQAEVARRMNVPQPAIVRLESGTHSPTLNTLSRYAAAIGVKIEVRRIA